jgi:hypothetical protein
MKSNANAARSSRIEWVALHIRHTPEAVARAWDCFAEVTTSTADIETSIINAASIARATHQRLVFVTDVLVDAIKKREKERAKFR